MKDIYSNRNPAAWILAMCELEHANPGERFEEDFASVFGEDIPADDELDEPEDKVDEQTGWLYR